MTTFPVVCTFAVVKMASSGNHFVSEHPQTYILRKHGFEVSQIMEILNKSKNWVMAQLKRRLLQTWKSINRETLVALVHSMPKRLKKFIQSKGSHRGY